MSESTPPTDEPKLHPGPTPAAGHHWRCPNAHPWLEEALAAFAVERSKAAAAAVAGDIKPWIALFERVLGQVAELMRFGEGSDDGGYIVASVLNLADRLEARERSQHEEWFCGAMSRASRLAKLARESRGTDQPLSEDAFMSLLDRAGLVEPPEPTAPAPSFWDALPGLVVQQLLPLLSESGKGVPHPTGVPGIEVHEVGAAPTPLGAVTVLVSRLVAGSLIKSEEAYVDSQVPRFYLVGDAYTAAERLFRAAGIEPEPKGATAAPDVEDLNREPVKP